MARTKKISIGARFRDGDSTHTHTHKMGVKESVLYLDCGSDDVSMCLSKLKELHDKK